MNLQNGLKITKQDKTFACQWLSKCISHPAITEKNDLDWKVSQVDILMRASFFSRTHPNDLHGIREAFFK